MQGNKYIIKKETIDMKSLLNVVGRKTDLDIKEYIDKIDKEIKIYCEPFAGGFSAGLTLIEQGFTGKVILNDKDFEVYNFFKCLQEDWERLFNECEALLVSMANEVYTDDMLHKIKTYKVSEDKYKRAASEYVYRKSLSMKGLSINFNKFKDTEIDFFLQSETLKQVEITNLDYKEVIDKYDSENTFMLIDPPYHISNVDGYYRCNSELFYHRELSEKIKVFKSKFLLTYNDDEYIKMLYEDYNKNYKHRFIGRAYFELYIDNIK